MRKDLLTIKYFLLIKLKCLKVIKNEFKDNLMLFLLILKSFLKCIKIYMFLWIFIEFKRKIIIKMNQKWKYIMTLILIQSVFWAQWPVGVDLKYTINTEAYSYSAISNLKIVNGYVWNDISCVFFPVPLSPL